MKWISVKDIEPPKDRDFLGWNGCKIKSMYWENDIDEYVANCECQGWEHNRADFFMTHWAELPEPPKES